MAFHYSPRAVTDGLVLYLDAANTQSYVSGDTTWNDLSRTADVANLVNTPTFTSDSGGGIELNGTNQRTLVPSTDLNFVDQPVTLESWVDVNTLPGDSNGNYFFTKTRLSGGFIYTAFQIFGTKLRLLVQEGTTTGLWLGDGDDVPLGKHHVCVTIDTDDIIFYLDGVQYGSSFSNTSNILMDFSVSSTDWNIGQFNGVYSDQTTYVAKMYDRTLSASEVAQNFNSLKGRFGL